MIEFAVMPSMRFLWAAGPAALKDNTVIKTIPGFRPAPNVIDEVEKAKANPVPEQTEVKLDESGFSRLLERNSRS